MKEIPSKLAAKFYDRIIELHHQEFGYGKLDYKNWLDLLVSKLEKRDKVLDLGCGNGRALKYLIDKGFDGTGIDASDKMLELAKRYVPRGHFLKKEIEKMNFKECSFNAVISFFALNHVSKSQFRKIIKKSNRVLSKNGLLLLGMVKGEGEGLFKGFYGKDLLLYGAGYAEGELSNILRENDYKIIKLEEKHFKGKHFEEDDIYILAKVKK